MLFPVKKEEATAFFNLINTLHEKTSIIITTNKTPTEWTQMLDDEVLTSALLDRLLYRCEVVKLTGTSYRLENRKTIFEKNKNKPEPVEWLTLLTGKRFISLYQNMLLLSLLKSGDQVYLKVINQLYPKMLLLNLLITFISKLPTAMQSYANHRNRTFYQKILHLLRE